MPCAGIAADGNFDREASGLAPARTHVYDDLIIASGMGPRTTRKLLARSFAQRLGVRRSS